MTTSPNKSISETFIDELSFKTLVDYNAHGKQ